MCHLRLPLKKLMWIDYDLHINEDRIQASSSSPRNYGSVLIVKQSSILSIEVKAHFYSKILLERFQIIEFTHL